MLRSALDAYLRHRFAWLLVLLVLTLGVDPLLEILGFRGRTLEWLLLFALAAALVGIWRRGGPRYLVVGSAAALLAWLVLRGVAFGGGPSLAAAALGVWSLLIAVGLLSVVLRAGRVDGERIAAALSVYMLVGLAFGGLFATLEAVEPGSLRGAGSDVADATYFSFVTLATLGYGDVLPVSRAARALATLETVFGQLYLAVLVARLVSLYRREDELRPPED